MSPNNTKRNTEKNLEGILALIFDMTEPCSLTVCPFLLPALPGHNNIPFLQTIWRSQTCMHVIWLSFDKNVGGFCVCRETKEMDSDIDC